MVQSADGFGGNRGKHHPSDKTILSLAETRAVWKGAEIPVLGQDGKWREKETNGLFFGSLAAWWSLTGLKSIFLHPAQVPGKAMVQHPFCSALASCTLPETSFSRFFFLHLLFPLFSPLKSHWKGKGA